MKLLLVEPLLIRRPLLEANGEMRPGLNRNGFTPCWTR
jgi:arsenate reductase-like glutaredoxin family protein